VELFAIPSGNGRPLLKHKSQPPETSATSLLYFYIYDRGRKGKAMEFNLFKSVGDYSAMIAKIAISTFVAALFSVVLLRLQFAALDELLSPLSISISLTYGITLPLGTVLPALIVALASRVFKLHDRISDLFHIRKRFDVGEILFPLAIGSGANLTGDQIRRIKNERRSLMYKVFYKYASGTKEKAVIDSHYITMALDQWCWYWIVLEMTVLAFLLGAVFFSTTRYFLAAVFFAGVLLALVILLLIRNECAKYAMQEVEAILEQAERKHEVAEAFRAL